MFDTNGIALVFYGCASGGGEDNFVALVKQNKILSKVDLPSLGLAQAISEKTSQLLSQTKETPQIVSVVTGPGSFTGLRATISIAQGLSLGWNVPLVGSSLYQAMLITLQNFGVVPSSNLCVLHHARRGFVYSLSANGSTEVIDFEKAASMNYVQVAGNAVDGDLSQEILRVVYRSDGKTFPSHPDAVSILQSSITNNISDVGVFPVYGEGARISKPKI